MSQKKDFGGKEQKNNRPQSPENLGKEPQREEFRHLLMGSPKVVTSIIHCLQLRGYAEFGDWSPFVPNPSNPEQVITILVRRVMFPKNTTK